MDAKAPRGRFGFSPSTDGKNRPQLLQNQTPSNEQESGTKSTNSSVKAWKPSLPDQPGSEPALTIPYSGQNPPSRDQYESILERRLKELIDQNPQRAENILSSSPEHAPELYEIAVQNPRKAWPILIVQSNRMQTLLNQIDWKKGTSLTLSQNELPDLEVLSETL